MGFNQRSSPDQVAKFFRKRLREAAGERYRQTAATFGPGVESRAAAA